MAEINHKSLALSASIIYLENKNKPKKMAKIKLPAPKPVGVQHIELVLRSMGVPFVNEYHFMGDRKFRFDIAIPERKIAIEYEGMQVKTKKYNPITKRYETKTSKSGHQTNAGFTGDCEKYNNAVCMGWKLLRFTAWNYEDATKFLSVLMPDK